jgi:cytoskeletal protein CcmA (bactofilin family)
MALVLNERVKETTTTTGTGALSLGGASDGFETFAAGIGNSNTTYYAIFHSTADEFEVGLGTLDGDSSDLTRTTIYASSNSDSAVNFSAGTKTVFCTMPAARSVFLDADGDVTLGANLTVGGNLDVTGTFDLSDSNFTNAGDIQLDSITGDGDTNTKIEFSGSDVITMTTGGTAALTIDASQNVTVAGDLTITSDIVTTSNADLELAPNGTGHVTVRGNTNQGTIQFNCENNSHGQQIKAAPHSESANNVLTLPSTGGDSRLVSTASTATLTNKTLTSPKINEDVAVTSTATELNALDGITAVVGELNALDLGSTAVGTAIASKAVILDANKDYTGIRNLTISGELDGATLDISGDADIDGTLEADAITVGGTALASVIAGTTVTLASTVTVTDSTANTNFPVVFHNESNALLDDTGALRYNPSTGELLVPKLTVAGTTTTVDTVTMNAENAIVFEGATADAHETTLTIIDPTGDRTINLPNVSGTIPVLAAASTTQITSTPEELNLLDGITAGTISVSLAVIVDSNKDIAGFRNINLTGELDAATLDISGDADIDGTLETDALSIASTLVTATAAELNFTDGVTSNIQTQLDTKTTPGFALAMAVAL